MPSQFPDLPWQEVASDLFVWNGVQYLLVIDYFSRYVEIAKLSGETLATVIKHLKSIFARHGILQELVTDNSLQYSSQEFTKFAENYGFIHTTSSPKICNLMVKRNKERKLSRTFSRNQSCRTFNR